VQITQSPAECNGYFQLFNASNCQFQLVSDTGDWGRPQDRVMDSGGAFDRDDECFARGGQPSAPPQKRDADCAIDFTFSQGSRGGDHIRAAVYFIDDFVFQHLGLHIDCLQEAYHKTTKFSRLLLGGRFTKRKSREPNPRFKVCPWSVRL